MAGRSGKGGSKRSVTEKLVGAHVEALDSDGSRAREILSCDYSDVQLHAHAKARLLELTWGSGIDAERACFSLAKLTDPAQLERRKPPGEDLSRYSTEELQNMRGEKS